MKEQSRYRIATIMNRFASRIREKNDSNRAAFDTSFRTVRDSVIRPVFEEVAAELGRSGFEAHVVDDRASETPSIELELQIPQRARHEGADRIVFAVIERRGMPEVLAYLVVRPPPLDLLRFASPTDITADQVEQIALDAVEHIFACHSI